MAWKALLESSDYRIAVLLGCAVTKRQVEVREELHLHYRKSRLDGYGF